jgi:hypothetical protein
MNRRLLYPVVLVGGVISLLPFAELPLGAGTDGLVSHTVIAASGGSAPAGGRYLPLFSNARVNAGREVVFDAVVGGPPATTGVFIGQGRTTSAIALGVNADPAAPSFGEVSSPFITTNGRVVFQANASDIFSSDGNTAVPLVRSGDPAPGGGTLTPTSTLTINDHGAVVYGAFIDGSPATRGIFRTDATGTVAIVREHSDVPDGGTFTSVLGDPVVNDRGQVAFFAELTGGPADFGIFRGEGAALTPVFVANQIAPGGETFVDFSDPVINRRGQLAAIGSLTNGASSAGLFVSDGTDGDAIALQGQPAPAGGNYRQRDAFLQPIRLNDRGEVAFTARLTGGTSSSGIFRGNGARTTTIARAGTSAPGTTGMFQGFDEIELGTDGRVAFVATLTVGVGGVNVSNNRGIWIGRSEDDLQLVVRTGDVISGSTLTRLPQQSNPGDQFDMNQNGVLWIGSFGAAKAIVYSRIPGGDDAVGLRH